MPSAWLKVMLEEVARKRAAAAEARAENELRYAASDTAAGGLDGARGAARVGKPAGAAARRRGRRG